MTKFTIIEGLVEVKVYSTVQRMRKALKRLYHKQSFNHTEAIVIPITAYRVKKDRMDKLPLVAEVLLHENVSIPVIAHEAIHIATVIHRSKKWDWKIARGIDFKEERFAYTVTYIMQELLKYFPSQIDPFSYELRDFKLDEIDRWARASRRKK